MTKQRSELHIETPIADAEEIPYDPAKKGPGTMRLQIEFDREEIERLRARHPRGPLIRFIKRAALETADREAKAKSGDGLHAAD
jgi:hypothetical protein